VRVSKRREGTPAMLKEGGRACPEREEGSVFLRRGETAMIGALVQKRKGGALDCGNEGRMLPCGSHPGGKTATLSRPEKGPPNSGSGEKSAGQFQTSRGNEITIPKGKKENRPAFPGKKEKKEIH